MYSNETWDGNPVYGTTHEILARDEWIMLRMNQYGAPTVLTIVSYSQRNALGCFFDFFNFTMTG